MYKRLHIAFPGTHMSCWHVKVLFIATYWMKYIFYWGTKSCIEKSDEFSHWYFSNNNQYLQCFMHEWLEVSGNVYKSKWLNPKLQTADSWTSIVPVSLFSNLNSDHKFFGPSLEHALEHALDAVQWCIIKKRYRCLCGDVCEAFPTVTVKDVCEWL